MRYKLRPFVGRRIQFQATFQSFGESTLSQTRFKSTVLLINVRDEHGVSLCDHTWFELTPVFEQLQLESGDELAFDAEVKFYLKGYFGKHDDNAKPIRRDYKLVKPKRIRKVLP